MDPFFATSSAPPRLRNDARALISESQIEEFEAAGAICLRGLFGMDWITRVRGAVERALAADSAESRPAFQLRHSLAAQDADVRAFVFESPAAEIARRLMRSRTVRYYFDQMFVKEPGAEAPTPWHHDQPYWPAAGRQICSLWLALDPVTLASGGLEYVYGSHLWGREYAPVPFTDRGRRAMSAASSNEVLPDIDANRDQYRFLSWEMQPGDCLVHQARAVHGASGNTTHERRRRALSVRWLGDDARYRAPAERTDPMLIDPTLAPGDRMESARFPLIIG
jgi:ectoine hydroxylase-related dioxygenase (phytanoyl-CoA dioxygenase family)